MQETSEKPTTTTTSSSILSPLREISFRRQQQFFFHQKAIMAQFTNPKHLFLYTGQTREEIPDDVLHVRVDPTVTVIDWDTFSGCKKLVTIEFPENGVVSIRGRAFMDCYSLKPPKFPSSLREIGDLAFSTCLAMNSIQFPEGLEGIGRATFPSCSFRTVKIPRSMPTVGEQSFSCCTDLVSIEIPYGVTAILDEAFFHCVELRNVAIPSTVNTIGDNAFECCFKLLEKFPEEEALIAALRTRYDGLPFHKICYYQAHHASTEETLQELTDIAEAEQSSLLKRQDAFGMTPLHLLALSKKQDIRVYQWLVERNPEDLLLEDTWGYLPAYYACLSGDASLEIVQYLLNKAPQTKRDWKKLVDSFSIMFVQPTLLRHVVYWCIEDRLKQNIEYEPWRRVLMSLLERFEELEGRRYWEEKENLIALVHRKLAEYELKEVTTLLELVAWKCKLCQSHQTILTTATADNVANENYGDIPTTIGNGEDGFRKGCRIYSGAELIISNVVRFL